MQETTKLYPWIVIKILFPWPDPNNYRVFYYDDKANELFIVDHQTGKMRSYEWIQKDLDEMFGEGNYPILKNQRYKFNRYEMKFQDSTTRINLAGEF